MSGLRASGDALAVLTPGLEEAVVRAVAASGIPDPFAVEVRLGRNEYPPLVRVGSDRFRERMTTLSSEREGAVGSLYEAKPPDGTTIELGEFLDDEAQVVCREMNAAYGGGFEHPDRRRASEISVELGRQLARRLNERDWQGVSEPFLVLVRIGAQYDEADPYELAAAAVGRKRVEAFRESIA